MSLFFFSLLHHSLWLLCLNYFADQCVIQWQSWKRTIIFLVNCLSFIWKTIWVGSSDFVSMQLELGEKLQFGYIIFHWCTNIFVVCLSSFMKPLFFNLYNLRALFTKKALRVPKYNGQLNNSLHIDKSRNLFPCLDLIKSNMVGSWNKLEFERISTFHARERRDEVIQSI